MVKLALLLPVAVNALLDELGRYHAASLFLQVVEGDVHARHLGTKTGKMPENSSGECFWVWVAHTKSLTQ
jgi:hypothetical protein